MIKLSGSTRRSHVGSNKSKRILRAAVVATPAVLAAVSFVQPAHAQLYWDINGANTGATDSGSGLATGVWDNSTANWTSDSTGASATTTWSGPNSANFSAGSNANGTYGVTVAAGTTILDVAGINFEEGNVTIAGGDLASTLTLTSPGIDVASGLTSGIDAVIAGSAGLTKTGAGTFFMRGVNTYTGTTTVSGGTLIATAFSMPAAVTNNATVILRGDLQNDPPLWSGTLLPTATSATYAGAISGSGNFIVQHIGRTFAPPGVYALTGDNSHTGTTTLEGGAYVYLASGGKFSGTSGVTISRATHFVLDNTATNDSNRVNDTAPVALNGGGLTFLGNATAASSETMGALSVGTGGTSWLFMNVNPQTVALNAHAAASTLTFDSFSRAAGSTLFVRGPAVGEATGSLDQVKFTTAPTLTGGILPGVFIDSTNYLTAGTAMTLATYDGTTGIKKLPTGSYVATFTANSNVAPTANATVSSSVAINALEFGGASDAASAAGNTVTISSGQTLTVNSGVILANASSASTITGGTLRFGPTGTGEAIIGSQSNTAASTAADANPLTIASVIQASSLTKEGSNPLTLTGTNNFTGTTYINRGRLIINQNNQLGSGVVVGNSGIVPNFGSAYNFSGSLKLAPASGGLNYTIPITIGGQTSNSSSSVGSLDSSAGTNTWSGAITLSGAGPVSTDERLIHTISVASGSTFLLNGTVTQQFPTNGNSLQGLNFTGDGITILRWNNSNYSGIIRQTGGTIVVESDGVFGRASDNGFEQCVIQNGSFQNTIAFRGGVNYTQKEWIFTNGGNDPAGHSTAGNLGLGNLGVIAATTGNNTFAGNIGFGNAGSGTGNGLNRISVVSGASLELSGQLARQGTGSGGVRTLDKRGTGDLIISGNNNLPILNSQALTFIDNSIFNVTEGRLVLRSSNPSGGNLPQEQDVIVRTNASLVLDNSLAVNNSRLASTTSVALSDLNAELKLVGNSSTNVTQPIASGNLSIASFSTVTVQPAGSTITELQLPSTSRSNRGTMLFRGMDNATSKINLASYTLQGAGGTGSLISVLPEAIGDTLVSGAGSDFVTVDGSGYVRTLASGEYIPLASGNGTKDNTTTSGSTSISAETTVNSIKYSSGTSIAINSGTRLYVFSGAMMGVGTGTSTISGGELTFHHSMTDLVGQDFDQFGTTIDATNEGIVSVPTGATLNISSKISGTDGLTVSGGGTLYLTGTNTFGEPTVAGISGNQSHGGGQTTINGARLQFDVPANLGYTGQPIVINGGTLAPQSVGTMPRNITLGSLGTNTIDTGASASLTLTGNLTGQILTKAGTGTLTLQGTNNYNGNIVTGGTLSINDNTATTAYTITSITNGTVAIGAATALGPATVAVTTNVATLRFDASMTFDHNISLNGALTVDTPGANSVMYVGSGLTARSITGTGNLIKTGTGTFIAGKHTNQNSFSGNFIINQGTLEFQNGGTAGTTTTTALSSNPGALQAGYFTLANGTTMRFNIPGSTPGAAPNSPNRGMTLTSGSATIEVPAPPSGNQIGVGNRFLAGAGRLIKTGPGEFSEWLATTNSTGNTFTGGFTVVDGTLSVTSIASPATTDIDRALGAVPGTADSSYVKLNGGTLFAVIDGSTAPINFAANRGFRLISDPSNVNNNPIVFENERGPQVMNFNSPITRDGGVNNDVQFIGKVSNNAVATRTIALSNSTNAWGDKTLVTSAGTFLNGVAATTGVNSTMVLRMGANNALPSNTSLFLQAPTASSVTILDLGDTTTVGFNQTVSGLYVGTDTIGTGQLGVSRVTNTGTAAATLAINNAGTNSFTGEITNANTNINHTGAGGLVLTNTNNNFGALDGTGTTTINTATVGRVRETNLSVTNGSTLTVRAVADPTNVTNSNNASSKTALTLGTNSIVDLKNNKLAVTNELAGSWNGSAYTGVTARVIAGKGGNISGVPQWNGTGGIKTSSAALNNLVNTLAIADASDVGKTTLGGQAVGVDDALVMYTWGGDSNLSGKVDADDYFNIDSNYNDFQSTNLALNVGLTFAKGDFNLDGRISADDYAAIDAGFTGQSANPIAPGSPAGVTAVPEPASFAVVSLAALSCLGRRRRK